MKIWIVNTCCPNEAEPCIPTPFATEAEANAYADEMMRAEWNAAVEWNGGKVEDEDGEEVGYPDDWREAQEILAARNGPEWGRWEITSHEIDLTAVKLATTGEPGHMAEIKGPLRFEPHNGYGSTIDGEPMPFGYISTSAPMPVFELDTPLVWPVGELRTLAIQMASAPEMLAVLKEAKRQVGAYALLLERGGNATDATHSTYVERQIDAAIAKAEGSA